MMKLSHLSDRDRRRRSRSWLFLTALLFFLAGVLSLTYPVQELSRRLNDLYFRLQPATESRDIVLVLIDDASLNRYGRWPWKRAQLARLISAVSAAHPKVIGVDVLLSEPEDELNDRALENAIRQAGNVILAEKIANSSAGPSWMEPLERFGHAAVGLGHVQAVLDPDGICRSVPASELSIEGLHWALALQIASLTSHQALFQERNKGIHLGEQRIRLDSPRVPMNLPGIQQAPVRLLTIHYRRQLSTSQTVLHSFQSVSAADLLAGFSQPQMSDKIVLIGFGSTGTGDELLTPVSDQFPMPGVEIHANLVDSVLHHRTLRRVSGLTEAALMLGISMLLSWVVLSWPGVKSLLFVPLFLLASYLAGFALFLYAHIQIGWGPLLFVAILAPPLGQLQELLVLNRGLDRGLRRLRQELLGDSRPTSKTPGTVIEQAGAGNLHWKLELLNRFQTELASLHSFQQTLLDSMQEALAVFAPDGSLLFSNGSWAVFCQEQNCLPPQAGLGFLDSLLEPGWRDFEGALSAEGARFESDLHVGNGLWQIAARRLPWTSHAGDSALMVMIANRTAYLERDRARSEALQFVTHELRTPLVSIQGFAEYLQRFPEQASHSTAATTIFREARRLVAMIDTYLSVLRLEAGAHVLRQETFSVPQILEEIKQVVRPLAQAGGIAIEWWIVSPSAMAHGDPALIGGALLNLLSNAIKYSPCGEVVEVCLSERSGELELEVWNTGTLASEEHLQRLFEPFYRIPGQTESKPGWGLGLAFVKRIAERHGGRVAVRTEKQRICFSLILPALSVSQEVQL